MKKIVGLLAAVVSFSMLHSKTLTTHLKSFT